LIVEGVTFVNSSERCIVCLNGGGTMVKHHIRYYPEAIAWVHSKCHQKIHDPENPMNVFIQYEFSDKERFESEKKVLDD